MERRRDGVNGWQKAECMFSKTGWAWHLHGDCTCEPCQPPRAAEPDRTIAVWQEPDDPEDYEPQEEPHG